MTFRALQRPRGGFRRLGQASGGFEAVQPVARRVDQSAAALAEAEPIATTADDEPAGGEQLTASISQGFEQGYREGLQRAREELQSQLDLVREITGQLEATRADVLADARDDAVDLLQASLRWLHLRTAEDDPELVVRVVDAVLEELQGEDPITLRIHPQDHEALSAELSVGTKPWAGWNITLRRDPEIERGGCRVEIGKAEIDATVSDRLARLDEELDRVRRNEPPRLPRGMYR